MSSADVPGAELPVPWRAYPAHATQQKGSSDETFKFHRERVVSVAMRQMLDTCCVEKNRAFRALVS